MLQKESEKELSAISVILSKEDMVDILSKLNSGNRNISETKVKEYVKVINDGGWDFNYLEGNILTFDNNLKVLSAQHRLKAMLDSTVEEWTVIVTFVDRDFWLSSTVESRTKGDKAVMAAEEMGLCRELATITDHIATQHRFITDRVSHVSKSSDSLPQSAKNLLYVQYYDKVVECSEILKPILAIKGNKALQVQLKGIYVLYAFGKISKSNISDLVSRSKEAKEFAKSIGRTTHVFHTQLLYDMSKYPVDEMEEAFVVPKGTFDGHKASLLM